MQLPPDTRLLTSYRKHWAQRFGTAPFLPMSRAEMDALGWDACDIILVTGDAYIDHPSFGMALVGRLLEAQGFRVGIISQPDWHSADDFKRAGQAEPVLRRHRRQHGFDGQPLHRRPQDPLRRRLHARTPQPDKRPDRAVIVYAQRCREAYPGRAARHRRHRGQPAPHRPLRLLVGQGAALDPARLQGRPAALRQRRARAGGTRPPPGQGRAHRRHPRPARHRLHGAARLAARTGWDGSRFDHGRHAGRGACRIPIPMR